MISQLALIHYCVPVTVPGTLLLFITSLYLPMNQYMLVVGQKLLLNFPV